MRVEMKFLGHREILLIVILGAELIQPFQQSDGQPVHNPHGVHAVNVASGNPLNILLPHHCHRQLAIIFTAARRGRQPDVFKVSVVEAETVRIPANVGVEPIQPLGDAVVGQGAGSVHLGPVLHADDVADVHQSGARAPPARYLP